MYNKKKYDDVKMSWDLPSLTDARSLLINWGGGLGIL